MPFGLETFYTSTLHNNIPILLSEPIFDQCSTSVETRLLVVTTKMFEKHLWQSDILSKDPGR